MRSEAKLWSILALLTGALFLPGPLTAAEIRFSASVITNLESSALMHCSLTANGLQDLIVMDNTNLNVFFQDSQKGFSRQPQQVVRFDGQPAMVWSAKMGAVSDSILILTNDGVGELDFTNTASPPLIRQIIQQRAILPAKNTNTPGTLHYYPLSVRTGGDWPLLLLPTPEGLQVWQHRDDWHMAQVIPGAVSEQIRPVIARLGYYHQWDMDLCVADLDGRGREALMTKSNSANNPTNTYSLYRQSADGLFDLQPALVYSDKETYFSRFAWHDLDHVGHLDLIKSISGNDPSFIPGLPSGKVTVAIYRGAPGGGIPAEPQQVFRKDDWITDIPLVDLDGDGYLDLPLGYAHLANKEAVTKLMAKFQIDCTLRFHCWRPGTGFPSSPDCQNEVSIRLNNLDSLMNLPFSLVLGSAVKFVPNFKGDGKAALLVRDHLDYISVYPFLSREKGFSAVAEARLPCSEFYWTIQALDLNGDGVCDFIIRTSRGWRILLSQK